MSPSPYTECCFDRALYNTFNPSAQTQSRMMLRGLDLVGWYHSHPLSEPDPSHNDILSQKKYQDVTRMKEGDEPCVGVIVSKYRLCGSILLYTLDFKHMCLLR